MSENHNLNISWSINLFVKVIVIVGEFVVKMVLSRILNIIYNIVKYNECIIILYFQLATV